MRRAAALPLVAVALAAACRDSTRPRAPSAAATADAPTAGAARTRAVDLALWARMDPAAFGCWMERTLGRRDPRWNCASPPYPADADPCDDEARFRDGPAFPAGAAPRLHPLLRDVALAWEGGALQRATFTFADGVAAPAMARAVGADGPGAAAAASAAPGACEHPCFVVTFFDAGEPDCDEEDDADD
jgi:hypothetical protein